MCTKATFAPGVAAGRSRPALRILAIPLLAALVLAACGHHHWHDDGIVLVDNRTHLTTNEALLTFRLAPFGEPFTGNLLTADVLPMESRNLGVWPEDYYDAEGDLELGQLIEWFDVFVGDGDVTVFEVR